MRKTIVVALGGNALVRAGQKGTAEEQLANLKKPAKQIAKLALKNNVALTHGNGPQVGSLLLQQETSKGIPKMPLDVCVAESQGLIGFLIEIALENAFRDLETNKHIATIVTGVVVDPNDPAFENPTKPIGPEYTEAQAKKLKYEMVLTPKGYRRVVPSPKPLRILQREEIKKLLKDGVIVIACGGGGIPLVEKKGGISGIEAVIDKDLATAKLAEEIKADMIVFLTDVPYAYLNYKKEGEKPIKKMTVEEAERYLFENQFPPGNMGPKVEAAVEFIKKGGKKAVITSLENLEKAVEGRAGTQIA